MYGRKRSVLGFILGGCLLLAGCTPQTSANMPGQQEITGVIQTQMENGAGETNAAETDMAAGAWDRGRYSSGALRDVPLFIYRGYASRLRQDRLFSCGAAGGMSEADRMKDRETFERRSVWRI